MERYDIFCPSVQGKQLYPKARCTDGHGKYQIENKMLPEDNINTLLNKVNALSKVDNKTVKWRRCLLLAWFATVLIYLFALRRFPNFIEFLLVVFIMFFVFSSSFSYYQYHHSNHNLVYIDENIERIKELLSQKA